MRRVFTLGVVTVSCLLLCVPAMGAKPKSTAEEARTEVYRMWNVDSMIRQASDNVSRRYNLNPEQAEFTRKMMFERVTKFLADNEEAIWPLVRDLARQQLTGKPPGPETAKRIGEAALPIVETAKKAIYEANEEWGDILSEEQKQLHEFDLREMEGQFAQVNRNFEEFQAGKPKPNPMFPEYEPKAGEPPRPKRPGGIRTLRRRQEDGWSRYVQSFIRRYQLDPGQRGTADSILRELKQDAEDHRASKAVEFKAVEKRFNEAVASGDLKKRMAAKREESVLNRRLEDLFEELKGRLDKIPTPGQKKAYQQSLDAKRTKTRHPSGSKTRGTPTRGKDASRKSK